MMRRALDNRAPTRRSAWVLVVRAFCGPGTQIWVFWALWATCSRGLCVPGPGPLVPAAGGLTRRWTRAGVRSACGPGRACGARREPGGRACQAQTGRGGHADGDRHRVEQGLVVQFGDPVPGDLGVAVGVHDGLPGGRPGPALGPHQAGSPARAGVGQGSAGPFPARRRGGANDPHGPWRVGRRRVSEENDLDRTPAPPPADDTA